MFKNLCSASAIVDWFENRPINKANRDKLTQAIQERRDFVAVEWASAHTNVKMLDYACGPGFLSKVRISPPSFVAYSLSGRKIFAPYVSSITAIDTSPTMIEKYTASIDGLNLECKNVTALVGNFLSDPPEPASLADDKLYDFDLITVGAALHHFPSASQAVQRLATRLRPGGVMYIQDLLEKNDHRESDKRPRGYSSDAMQSIIGAAGLVDFGFVVFPDEMDIELPNEEVLKIRCFAARAKKPKEIEE